MRRSLPWRFLRAGSYRGLDRGSFRSPRHLIRLPCQLVRERDFRLVGDRITNLSTSGLLVMPTDPVLTGERLILSFELGGQWIDSEVSVARVAHGRRPGERTRGLGLELEQIDKATRKHIADVLETFPLAPPCWRPGRRSTVDALQRLVRRAD